MTSLLELREYIKQFYIKYETIITYVWKFLLAIICIAIINSKIGYQSSLTNILVVLMVSLLCSILPPNFIILASAGFTMVHLYALSLECALVVGIVFLLMFLLYFRFTPKDTLAVLLTPILCVMNIPYVMPVALGLFGTPVSIVSMSFGVMVYYMISYVSGNATSFSAADIEETAGHFQTVVSEIVGNKEMYMVIITFAVALIIVYAIRRMSIAHAWEVAIIAGLLVELLGLLVGELLFETQISLAGIIIGILFSGAILKCIQFFAFNLDYSRTEIVQFEDDEYYYYVKAVPKVSVATPERRVKKINRSHGSVSRTQAATKSQSSTRTQTASRTQGTTRTQSAQRTRTSERSLRDLDN